MTETEIDEGAWVERYVTGRLEASELARFEAHLVDCPTCLDRVDAAARLGAALRHGADAPSPFRAPPRWAHRVGRWASGGLAVAAVALVVGSWVIAQRARRTESELSARLADTERQLAQARLEADRARVPLPSPPPARIARVPVLVLLATRGPDAPLLRLPEPAQPVVLSVEREDPPHFPLYRATLRTRAGTTVWQDTVAPGSREAVFIALESSLLPPGEYRLVLEGQAHGDRWSPVGEHLFRTAPAVR